MKTVMLVVTLLILIIFLLWFIGPRYVIKTAPAIPPTLPENLDAYLQEKESKIPDLKEGTKKEIIWAYEDKRITEYAIVYLHGFASSRKELSPVFEDVARELGANIFFTRFKGHGSQTGELLNTVDPDDWMEDALEARAIGHRIGQKLIIAGTSHGALLSSWVVTQEFPLGPEALILVSPNFKPRDPRTTLLPTPWAKQLLPVFLGNHRNWEAQNSGHEFYWNTRYPVHALFPMMAQVDYITPTFPEKVKVPTLVFYSTQDATVSPDMIEQAFRRFPSQQKLLIPVENSGDRDHHIIGGEILSPHTTADLENGILEFIRSL
jgi:esterase/lipase